MSTKNKNLSTTELQTLASILALAIPAENAVRLFESNRHLFDLSLLRPSSMQTLCQLYNGLEEEDLKHMSRADRLLLKFKNPVFWDKIEIPDNPTHTEYKVLIDHDFEKYADAERISKLCTWQQLALFTKHPVKYKQLIGIPKISSVDLMRFTDAFIDTHLYDELDNIVIQSDTMIHLLKYNWDRFLPVFCRRVETAQAQFIRDVIYENPELIEEISIDSIVASKLSIKEWVHTVAKSSPKTLSSKTVDNLEQALSMELLSGSKNSAALRHSLEKLRKITVVLDKTAQDTTSQTPA